MSIIYDNKIMNLDKRIIINPSCIDQPKNISLFENVLIYSNGDKWKFVPIKTLTTYPVIHDKYIETENQNSNIVDITIAYCPYTNSCGVFEGLYKPSNILYNGCMTLENNTKNKLCIITGEYIDDKNMLQPKRHPCNINLLRYALSSYLHCCYVDQNIMSSLTPIVDENYSQTNNFDIRLKNHGELIHAKTIVYLIQYKSIQTDKLKATVVIGSDANGKTATGSNIGKNHIEKYFKEMENKIIEKIGYIIPMYWFASQIFYPDAKLLYL